MAGILDDLGVLVESTLLVLERRCLPAELSLLHLLLADIGVDDSLLGIDGDSVAVFDESDGTTVLSFRDDVTDEETVAATTEASVSKHGNVVTKTGTHNCGRRSQHLNHTRTTLGTLVTNDNNSLLALLERATLDGLDQTVLAVEDSGLASELGTLLSGDLGDTATRGNLAVQNLNVTSLLDRVAEGADDLLALGHVANVLEVLSHSLTGDGHTTAVNGALLQEELEDSGRTTNVVKVSHDVLAGRLEVGKQRSAVTDGLHIVRSEGDADGVSHGDQVENCVGRTTSDVDNGHGVLESLAGHDVRGANVLFEKVLDSTTSGQTFELLGLGHGRVGGRTGKGHTHGFDDGSHGVGSVHTTTSTTTGAGVLDDVLALILVDLASDELAVSLESRDDVESLVSHLATSSSDGTSVDHDCGSVDSSHGHDDTGHILVATRERDVGVVPLAAHDGLDRVGDDVARLQRVAHTGGTVGHAVTDTNGVELHTLESSSLNTLVNLVTEVHQVHVAGVTRVPDRRNTDLGLVHILVGEASGVQHGLRGTVGLGLSDDGTSLVEGILVQLNVLENLVFARTGGVLSRGESLGDRRAMTGVLDYCLLVEASSGVRLTLRATVPARPMTTSQLLFQCATTTWLSAAEFNACTKNTTKRRRSNDIQQLSRSTFPQVRESVPAVDLHAL